MADVKISGLPASTVPLAGTEVLPIVQGGATKQVSIANVTAGRAIAATSITTDTYKAASSSGGALQNSGGTPQLQWGAGGGNNLSVDVAININPANAAVAISPTGTGTVAISPAGALTINPTAASTINNTSIGVTTAAAGRFSSITNTAFTAGSVVFAGASGVYSENNAKLFWNNTNNRLGIGTASPGTALVTASAGTVLSGTAYNVADITNAEQSLGLRLGYDSSNGGVIANAGVDKPIAFWRYSSSAGAYVESMRIFSTGGVSIGNTTDPGANGLRVSGLIYPQQAATASGPAYVKGAIYFDTTLNKLRVGGATDWETITSV